MSHSQKAVFPWLAYGHIVPFLQVSQFLGRRGHHIYYISTPKIISRLPKLPLQLSSNITFISLSLPHVDGLRAGAESTSELPIHKVPYLKKAYDKLEPQLTEFLRSSPQVKWIIHDFCPHWLPHVATQLGINLVYFSIVSASSRAFFGPSSELLGRGRRRPEELMAVPKWMDYPNNIAFKLHEVVSHQQCMDTVSDAERLETSLLNCKILALRTCFEFEPDALRVLRKIHQKPVIVPLGLLPPSIPSDELDKNDQNWAALKKWLDVIESLGLGVALVLFPGESSDLGLVARLMHGKKLGLEIERNDVDGSFTIDLVAASIRSVMVDPEGEQIRANACTMKEIFGNVELSKKYLEEFSQSIEQFPTSNYEV
ncbi:hypothetical protein PTKIN_Ptkin19aG0080200 [Pterospermum kingtungense]